jgi:hypothetical protein
LFFSIIIIWDVIPTPLTNSIIFQDVFLTTNQLVFTILTYMGIYGKKKTEILKWHIFFWGWWESIGIGGTLLSDKPRCGCCMMLPRCLVKCVKAFNTTLQHGECLTQDRG